MRENMEIFNYITMIANKIIRNRWPIHKKLNISMIEFLIASNSNHSISTIKIEYKC